MGVWYVQGGRRCVDGIKPALRTSQSYPIAFGHAVVDMYRQYELWQMGHHASQSGTLEARAMYDTLKTRMHGPDAWPDALLESCIARTTSPW